MAAIDELINKITDSKLRESIAREIKRMEKRKKFGLVFEEHLPEATPLYDVPLKKGSLVARKNREIDDVYRVVSIKDKELVCCKACDNKLYTLPKDDYVVIAPFGEPIFPYLKKADSVCNAPDSNLWHTLIEADNYHALQLLVYLYSGKVDCIYIDPPYNTGARDWKYNNDYVDGSDEYRHSKWLSFMEKRLLLAKKLLNPKCSVLICTIDEKEYLHLGCLLEELFPYARIQMVTSVISAKGVVRTGQFSRVEEYLFIVEMGDSKLTPIEYNMLDSEIKKDSNREIEWLGFRRRAPQAVRASRPNQFYPIFVDKRTGQINSIGDVLSYGINRETIPVPDNCIALWPLSKNGDERLWSLQQKQAVINWSKGYLKVHWDAKKETGTVYYLPEGTIADIESGKATTLGYNVDGSIKAIYYETGTTPPKRVWIKSTHNAETYGTTILTSFIGKRFDFPKSLYAVHDVIRFYVSNKPNALIVDFFAGSGTTLHAVNLLNKEDGGHRRCIMVTNNEVSADDEERLKSQGLQPGNEEWEKWGITRYVNWPRTKCSILGIDVNGNPVNGSYLTYKKKEKKVPRSIKQLNFDIPEGKMGGKVKKQIIALMGKDKLPQSLVKGECPYIVTEDYPVSILFDDSSVNDWLGELEDQEHIKQIYINTQNNKLFRQLKTEIQELLGDVVEEEPITYPMSDGFKSNCIFFKLGFLDKNAVALGRQFSELMPILWMKSGCVGECPLEKFIDIPPMVILPKNKFAVLTNELFFKQFDTEISQHKEIETVFLITDSEQNFLNMTGLLSGVTTYQLYRDYLENFTINYKH